jgi:hypothetical protein
MHLEMTRLFEVELEMINERIIENEEAYDHLNEKETLITDAGLYVDGAYEENEFSNLEQWCKLVGESEYDPKYLKQHPTAVLDKVNKMINEGILVVVE